MENQDYDGNLNNIDNSMFDNDDNDNNSDSVNNDIDNYQNIEKLNKKQNLIVDTPNIGTIKDKLKYFEDKKIDFTNFENEYAYVYNINETLMHSLSVLYENSKIFIEEEKKMVEGMKKAGIVEEDLSSKAWKPLALIREKIMYIFIEIRDIQTLTNDFNLLLAYKLRNALIENKGMSINKEVTARQIELSELTAKNQMVFFNKVLEDKKQTEFERTQIFERSIGNLVGMIQDVNSTKIKNIVDKCELIKKDIVNKEKLIESQDEKNNDSKKIIENLNKEIFILKQSNSFNQGFIKKINESEELRKNTNISDDERIDNFSYQPTNNQPTNNQPMNNQPINNQPINNQSMNNQPMNDQPINNQLINNQPINNQLKNVVDNEQISLKNKSLIKNDSGSVIDELKIETPKPIIYKQLESQNSLKKLLRQKDMLISSYNDIGDKDVSKIVETICKEIIKKRDW